MNDVELADRHRYRLPTGVVATNVTSVTGMLDEGGKSAKMAAAAARLTREGTYYLDEWADKRNRGTRIHANCEAWLRGEPTDVLIDDAPIVYGLEQFFKDYDPKSIEIERVVLSYFGYGGRFDFIAVIDGQNTLVDVKTGRPYPIEHTLQLSAYQFADGMAIYNADNELEGLEPLPHIDRACCLYLNDEKDPGYELCEYPVAEDTWHMFLSLLDLKEDIAELKRRTKR